MHMLHLAKSLFTGLALIHHAASHHIKGTSAQRIAEAKGIPAACNQKTLNATVAAFETVSFAPNNIVEVDATGRPPVIVATNRTGTLAFADLTAQFFKHVNATYTDFASGTTITHADVTLGESKNITLPSSFSADVDLIFNLRTCKTEKLRAVGDVPTALLGAT